MPRGSSRAGIALLTAIVLTAIGAMPAQAANKAAARAKVDIAIISIAHMAPIQLGIEKGFYRRQGIDVVLNKNLAQTAYPQAIVSGAIDGYTVQYGVLAIGVAAGIPLVGINTLTAGGLTAETDDPQLVTRADSGIRSVADLKGKTIAVNNVGSVQEITVRRAAQRAGIGATSVKVIGIPFAQMGSVLRNKQVDAALIADPFTTQLKQQIKLRLLAGSSIVWRKGQQVATLVMSRKWWDANKAVGRRLQLATRQAVDYAARNPREVRRLLPAFTGVPASVTSRQPLPRFVSKMDVRDIQNTARVMRAYNAIKTLPDMSKFLIPPPAAPKKQSSKR